MNWKMGREDTKEPGLLSYGLRREESPMSKSKNMISYGLLPVLALLSTTALIGIFFQLDASLSNSAQQAQWAKNHNSCVFSIMNAKTPNQAISISSINIATAVRYCNGG
tara:strand:+ start:184 stop:510 length:327 start_codon:yes stop_codon:yes gene_type:complete